MSTTLQTNGGAKENIQWKHEGGNNHCMSPGTLAFLLLM